MNEAYLEAITDAFLAAAGRGLMLSARDVEFVRGWFRAGVPVEIVVEAIGDAFERPPARRVRGLAFVAPAVQRAAERWRERRVGCTADPDRVETTPIVEGLERLRADLSRAGTRMADQPAMMAALEVAHVALGVLVSEVAAGRSDDLDEVLWRIARRLTDDALAALPEGARDRVVAHVELRLREERAAGAGIDLDEARAAIQSRWMRRHLGLPRFEITPGW